ncbi:MAG: nucleotidyltransferase domain-containing protein [Candidatus Aenigmatarchaeota archaeon]
MVEKLTKWKLLFPYLNDYRRSLILADFERELGKPHQTLKRYLEELLEENTLRIEGKGKHKKYSLNTESFMFFHHLSIAEKLRADEVLGERTLIKRLYEKTAPFLSGGRFLVFGSYAVGREGNDIDLLVVGEDSKELNETLKEFGDTYKSVHKVQVLGKEGLDRRFKKELHKKHIILSGSDYFVRLFGDMYGEFGMV